jgi:predicted RNA-binding protein associated with RNAse of E/G family
MKKYRFDLKSKYEKIKTHVNDTKFDFTEYREFNPHVFGYKRSWEKLSSHNSIKFVKRLLIPQTNFMFSYFQDEYGEKANYLIYIDFGKYKQNKNYILFHDLELDILIKKDFSFEILDMDELFESYENSKISNIEIKKILFSLEKTINSFSSKGVLESLYEIAGEEPIDWLTNNYL